MKAILGIDSDGTYKAGLKLLGRLQFANLDLELVHVQSPLTVYPNQAAVDAPSIANVVLADDDQDLNMARAEAVAKGLNVNACLSFVGAAPEYLMAHADETHADLICVGSNNRSSIGGFLLGSVGRALSIGSHHSILIAKQDGPESGPVTSVIATDHSSYADDAIVMLARMKPQGLGRLLVLSILDKSMTKGATEGEREDLMSYMASKSSSIVTHLRESGFDAYYRIVEGEFDDAVQREMTFIGADLLIMGAQGHGFMDRIFLGSSSLRQVVSTSHNVMILRPR